MKKFEGVEDTLYIPLAGRIYTSKNFPEYFYDKKALELEQQIPYFYIREKSSEYTMIAPAARCYNMDQMIMEFMNRYTTCNVVNLGGGLETTSYRVNKKSAFFYLIDFSKVIDEREKLIAVNENEKLVKADMFSMEWVKEIDVSIPTMMVVSGVFMYFKEIKVYDFIKKLQGEFRKMEIIFDATNEIGIKYANRYVKKTGNLNSTMHFFVNNATEFVNQFKNIELVEERVFYENARKILGNRIGLYTRIAMRICDNKKRAIILRLKSCRN